MMEIGPQLKDLLETVATLAFGAFVWWLVFGRRDD